MLRFVVCGGRPAGLGSALRGWYRGTAGARLCPALPGRCVGKGAERTSLGSPCQVLPGVRCIRVLSTSSSPAIPDGGRLVYTGNLTKAMLVAVPVKTITKYIVCETPTTGLFYTLCDNTTHVSISVDPCLVNWKEHVNLSATFIPRKNFDYAYALIEIWKDELKVSKGRFNLCSGIDDMYTFCGALKGETVTVFRRRPLYNLPFIKGSFLGKLRIFAGQKEEQIICVDFTVFIKD